MQEARVEPRHYSVTELAFALNACMEDHFARVPFVGEISQITRAASGHIYFTLKDEQSQVQAAMWRSSASRLTFHPEQGDEVLCSGTANFYNRSGRFQMIVHKMVPVGEGDLRRRFLQLKAKLEREGLFDESRKRSLPFFPRAVGVVTSSTGAVIHDIMVKIKERMPSMPVVLIGVRVQGEGAAAEIAAAIRQFNRLHNVDVLIVGRGGGSLEDLWPFNEEEVVRAVFASKIPIVSGVGHETDIALSDLAADKRAPTPTAAAEMVVPHREQLLQKLEEFERRLQDTDRWFEPRLQVVDELADRLRNAAEKFLEERRWRLTAFESKVALLKPTHVLRQMALSLDTLDSRLSVALQSLKRQKMERWTALQKRLAHAVPSQRLRHSQDILNHKREQLTVGVSAQLTARRRMLDVLEGRLEALSPQGVLERGFGYVRLGDTLVKEVQQLKKEDKVEVVLSRGSFSASVIPSV